VFKPAGEQYTLGCAGRSSVPSIQKSVTEKRKPSEDTTLGRTNEKPASNPFDLRQDDNTLLRKIDLSASHYVYILLVTGVLSSLVPSVMGASLLL